MKYFNKRGTQSDFLHKGLFGCVLESGAELRGGGQSLRKETNQGTTEIIGTGGL